MKDIDLIIYGGIGLLAVWYFSQKKPTTTTTPLLTASNYQPISSQSTVQQIASQAPNLINQISNLFGGNGSQSVANQVTQPALTSYTPSANIPQVTDTAIVAPSMGDFTIDPAAGGDYMAGLGKYFSFLDPAELYG